MRIAIYNRFWSTGGGGERYGGAIAAALAVDHEVDLLTTDDVDMDWLAERLHLDLSGTRQRRLDPSHIDAVEKASDDYDLLINVCYQSADVNRATTGIYVVHFPSPPVWGRPAWRRGAARAVRRLVPEPDVRLSWGKGFYPAEPGSAGTRWTNGRASLFVSAPEGRAVPLDLVFANFRPRVLGPTTVSIQVDGEETTDHFLAGRRLRVRGRPSDAVRVVVPGRGERPVELSIRSETFRPDRVVGTDDARNLGVALTSIRLGGRRPWVRRPEGWRPPPAPGCLDSYDAVVANSAYTREWIARRWSLDSHVLHPPARPGRISEKGRIILAVGRFFAPEIGHSKKQLELVEALRRLHERGLQGWTLHFVGGCKDGEGGYLERVRRAGEGLPVEFHIDATGAELEELLGRAALYWHATGLDEDTHRHPERYEHFGIATVEAMSVGAVPIVIGHGGPREIVRDGVDGFHFATLDELVCHTDRLIADDELRSRMSAAAIERARNFSDERFAARLGTLVDRVVKGATGTRTSKV